MRMSTWLTDEKLEKCPCNDCDRQNNMCYHIKCLAYYHWFYNWDYEKEEKDYDIF